MFSIVFRRRYVRRRRKARKAPGRRDYLARKEAARTFVAERLAFFMARYAEIDPAHAAAMQFRRVSIRNTR